MGSKMGKSTENRQLDQLGLTVKTYNCLRRAGIHTIDSLLEMTEKKLLGKRGFGEIMLADVVSKLERKGYKLRED